MAAGWCATCCCRQGSPNYAGLVRRHLGRITTPTTRREIGDWLSSGLHSAVAAASTSIWPTILAPTTASFPVRTCAEVGEISVTTTKDSSRLLQIGDTFFIVID